jgi:hypothetical protein
MSGSGLAIVADAVVLIALWLVVVTGWGPRRARFPLAFVSFGSAWTLAFLMAESRTPAWRGLPTTLALVISLVLLIGVAKRSMPSDSEGGDSDGGGGGLERPPPDRPNGGGGPAEPSWWPEFERDFARYLVQRERAKTGGDRPRVNR